MKAWFTFLLCSLVATVGVAHAQHYPAPVQALATRGITITGSLPAPPGYRGFIGQFRGRPMPVYLLPDGHVMIGTLFDDKGADLTTETFQSATRPKLDASTWDRLAQAHWVAEGDPHARRVVYVFTDTECPYCHELWQEIRPYVQKGDVQVRHIIVAIIAPKSAGRGAAVLAAAHPAQALAEHEQAFRHSPVQPMSPVPAAQGRELKANNDLMDSLGISGTPAIAYRDSEGQMRIVQGMQPRERLETIFGR